MRGFKNCVGPITTVGRRQEQCDTEKATFQRPTDKPKTEV